MNPSTPFFPKLSDSFFHVTNHGSSASFSYPSGIFSSGSPGLTTPAAAMSASSSALIGYSSHTLSTRAGSQFVTVGPVVKYILSSSCRSAPL